MTRLNCVMVDGHLQTSDLAYWFDRPYPTVRTWVQDGRSPMRGHRQSALSRLGLLEHAVAKQLGFPVPANVRAHDRPKYIVKIRDELEHAAISQGNPS